MTDDQNSKNQQNVGTDIPERPLDPTQNAGDMFNDTSGMSGVTQGGAKQSSAEPTDEIKDETEIKGGVIQNPSSSQPTGFPKSTVSDEAYNEQTQQGMSTEKKANADDTASEPSSSVQQQPQNSAQQAPSISPQGTVGSDTTDNSVPPSQTTPSSPSPSDFGDQTNTKYNTSQDAPYQQPYNKGEQDAMGGTTPDPRTDDDTLANAQRTGFQTGEDTEHPQEVNAGRDIDKAEEEIKES